MPKWRLKNMTYSKPIHKLKREFEDKVLERTHNRMSTDDNIRGTDMWSLYYPLIMCEEKMRLIQEYERQGRSVAFVGESYGELIYRKRELINKLPAEQAVKWMIPGIDIEAIKAQHEKEKRTTP